MHSPDLEYSVLSAQCNSSALTVCTFLFNVTNNTVLALLVSCLLILLSILLYLLRCRRPVRLNVRLTRLFTIEFRVSIDNFLECWAKPVVLLVVVQEGVAAEELRAEAVRLHADTPRAAAVSTLRPRPCRSALPPAAPLTLFLSFFSTDHN